MMRIQCTSDLLPHDAHSNENTKYCTLSQLGQDSTHMNVYMHVGDVADVVCGGGVGNNIKCKFSISISMSISSWEWTKLWLHQEDTSILVLAQTPTLCYRKGAHTQWTMQVTVHWVLWFCDTYQFCDTSVHDDTPDWHQSLLMITSTFMW